MRSAFQCSPSRGRLPSGTWVCNLLLVQQMRDVCASACMHVRPGQALLSGPLSAAQLTAAEVELP